MNNWYRNLFIAFGARVSMYVMLSLTLVIVGLAAIGMGYCLMADRPKNDMGERYGEIIAEPVQVEQGINPHQKRVLFTNAK